jgi:hypothetical protein
MSLIWQPGLVSTALISDRIGPVWTTVIAFFARVAVFGLIVIDQSTLAIAIFALGGDIPRHGAARCAVCSRPFWHGASRGTHRCHHDGASDLRRRRRLWRHVDFRCHRNLRRSLHPLAYYFRPSARSNGDRAIGIEELHKDYVQWSASGDVPLARFQTDFDRVRELPDLTGKIRKFGDRY